jgi:hypothetical protein
MKYLKSFEKYNNYKVGDYVELSEYISREKEICKFAKIIDIEEEDCDVETIDGEKEVITLQNIKRKLTPEEIDNFPEEYKILQKLKKFNI